MVVYAPMRNLVSCYIGLNENAPPPKGSRGVRLFEMIKTCDFGGAGVAWRKYVSQVDFGVSEAKARPSSSHFLLLPVDDADV